MNATKDEKPKNERHPHEGFGDGDDGDPEDRLLRVMMAMALSGRLLAACASARAHGLEYDDIRQAFDVQLRQLIETEKAIAAITDGMPVEEALDSARAVMQKRVDTLMGADSATNDSDKKSS